MMKAVLLSGIGNPSAAAEADSTLGVMKFPAAFCMSAKGMLFCIAHASSTCKIFGSISNESEGCKGSHPSAFIR
ncbi:MAG TPA: hypothetical protein VGM92_11905 [Candidatus Kapabacteria bacterium]